MKKQTKKQQSGRSMIEMVGVLAIMGLITAAAFVLINSAMSSQRLSRIDDDVAGIVNGVRLLYNSQPDFNGAETGTTSKGEDTLILLGFGNGDKAYQNPYGGKYEITQSVQNKTFTVTITGLGDKTCTVLAARDWTGATSKGTCTAGTDGKKTLGITYGKSDERMNP